MYPRSESAKLEHFHSIGFWGIYDWWKVKTGLKILRRINKKCRRPIITFKLGSLTGSQVIDTCKDQSTGLISRLIIIAKGFWGNFIYWDKTHILTQYVYAEKFLKTCQVRSLWMFFNFGSEEGLKWLLSKFRNHWIGWLFFELLS